MKKIDNIETESLLSRTLSLWYEIAVFWTTYIGHYLYVLANITIRMLITLFQIVYYGAILLGQFIVFAAMHIGQFILFAAVHIGYFLVYFSIKVYEGSIHLFHFFVFTATHLGRILLFTSGQFSDVVFYILRLLASFFCLTYQGGSSTIYQVGYYLYKLLYVIYG